LGFPKTILKGVLPDLSVHFKHNVNKTTTGTTNEEFPKTAGGLLELAITA
jgi:hypothetical protein